MGKKGQIQQLTAAARVTAAEGKDKAKQKKLVLTTMTSNNHLT